MRRDRYLEQFTLFLPYLRNVAMKLGLDYDEASEVIGICAEEMLSNKLYVERTPHKLKAFLRQHIRFAAKDFIKRKETRRIQEPRLLDSEQPGFDSTVAVANVVLCDLVSERECPFCFHLTLNEYGACYMCHTIVPSHIRTQHNTITLSEESLAVVFDFNTRLDIQNAIAQLEPFEQRVVIAIGLGNETLDSFSDIYPQQRMRIWRTWIEAKGKLQELLQEYSSKRLSKRSQSDFYDTVKSLYKSDS